jgi:hypothetical protein
MNYVVKNNWQFDTKKMQTELQILLNINEINQRRIGGLHGISLTSQDGSLQSGFGFNVGIQYPKYPHQDFSSNDPRVYFDLDFARENKVYHMLDYNIPTTACTGYFKEIIEFLHEKNMNPRRCRLSYLPPNGIINRHTDGNFYRFHIPIHTEGTNFVHGDIDYILEEGNSYLAYVHPYHYVKNQGSADRWHFVADVWDTEGHFEIGKVSKEQLNIELENATLWRDYVDNKRNTPNKILVREKN